MFCQNCGLQFESGKFCPYCGSPAPNAQAEPTYNAPQDSAWQSGGSAYYQPEQPPQQDNYSQPEQPQQDSYYQPEQPTWQQPYTPQPPYPGGGYGPYGGSPLRGPSESVLDTVRRLATGPAFLVGAIAYTLAMVLSIISSLTLPSNLVDIFSNLMNKFGYSREAMEIFSAVNRSLDTTVIISIIIGSVPTVLIALGMWLCFASAKNREKQMSTTGLTIIKVITIISFVCLCLVIVAIIILLIVAASVGGNAIRAYGGYSGYYGYEDYSGVISGALSSAVIILVFLALAALTLGIFYYILLLKTINSMRNTIQTGEPSDKVSGFVAVMSFIGAAGSIIGGFSSLSLPGTALSGISSLLSATCMIAFGVLIFQYRKSMRQHMGIV